MIRELYPSFSELSVQFYPLLLKDSLAIEILSLDSDPPSSFAAIEGMLIQLSHSPLIKKGAACKANSGSCYYQHLCRSVVGLARVELIQNITSTIVRDTSLPDELELDYVALDGAALENLEVLP